MSRCHDAGIPAVAIDPKGDWWGVRSSADGKHDGLSVVVFGGEHQDVPLSPDAGGYMADLIATERLTCVLDVSQFSKAEEVNGRPSLDEVLDGLDHPGLGSRGRRLHPRTGAVVNIVNELTAEQLAYWADQPEAAPIIMRAPPGMDDCTDCSAVLTTNDRGERVVRVAWKPDEIELVHLARGGTIWLLTWGGLPPHMLEVQSPE